MNTFMNGLEAILTPIASKLQANKYLQAISTGLMQLMPILMVGAIASLINNLQIQAFQDVITSTGISTVLGHIVTFTSDLLALYAAFTICNTFVTNEGEDGIPAGIISLLSFFIVTPLSQSEELGSVLELGWLGAQGLFTSMILSLLVGAIYVFLIKKDMVIKMPEGVPPFVAKSFTGIIPAVVISVLMGIVAFIFNHSEYGTIHQLVYSLIQSPLQGLGTSLTAVVIVYILEGLCWFVGVHAIAIAAVVLPVWLAAGAENVAGTASNIVTWGWVNTFAGLGGAGGTLGLVILMLLFSKSSQNKAVGTMAVASSVFGINEPVVFGVPVVLNPYLVIPFVFAPVISLIFAYGMTVIGFLPICSGINNPTGTPIFLAGFLQCGWQGVVVQVIIFLIGIVIYYPFFKLYDKKCLENENANI